MPRFAVLEHSLADGSVHWDLLLEAGTELITWQMPAPPDQWRATPQPCRQLPNHRIVYLDYEGTVSHNRGTVRRVAAGNFHTIESKPDRLTFAIPTGPCAGHWRLKQTADAHWQLTYLPESD